jgi:catalase
VGNNFPVFFIRDGIKFPDMVHAFKPNPKTNQQEGWRIMDFLSHHPESAHMVCAPAALHTRLGCTHPCALHLCDPQLTFLLDDVGIPKCYRTMPGFGVHTFRLLTKVCAPKVLGVPRCWDVM